MPRKVARLIVLVMNRTEPSPKRALIPPEWKLYGSSFCPAWLPWVRVVLAHSELDQRETRPTPRTFQRFHVFPLKKIGA